MRWHTLHKIESERRADMLIVEGKLGYELRLHTLRDVKCGKRAKGFKIQGRLG